MPTPVSEFMTTPVLTVDADETLAAATEAMTAKGMHSLVVITEDCRPAGVFTSTDLMAAAADGDPLDETTVGDRMTTDVVTVAPDESIEGAAAVMREHDVSHLPVVDEQVVGILTETDLATYLSETREPLAR